MPRSFQDRLDEFCTDFAAIGTTGIRGVSPSLELVQSVLPRQPDEEESEFSVRCFAMINTYAYVFENWAAFQNLGFIRDTESGGWTIEGPLLYALCLYLGFADSCYEKPPELETVIEAALHGPV